MCRVGVGEMDGIKAYIRFGKAGDRVYAFGPFNQRGQHTASGQAAIFRDRQSPLQVAARHRDDLTASIAALAHSGPDGPQGAPRETSRRMRSDIGNAAARLNISRLKC